MKRPVVIAAGGTGGHVVPALAVAEELRVRDIPVVWLGTRSGLEARMVPSAGFELRWIDITGLRGQSLGRTLLAPFRLLRACWQSMKVMRSVNAGAVLGMGGFVSGPAGLAALSMRRPLILHEQNAVAGMTNRWLARLATLVFSAWPSVFPPAVKAQQIGNPVRQAMAETARQHAEVRMSEARHEGPAVDAADAVSAPLKLLIVGGSRGASVFNDTMPRAAAAVADRIVIWHQVGADNRADVLQRYAADAPDAEVRVDEFIDDMLSAYQWADLVLCRAGAMTVTELAALGKASILVPYPHAVDDHQRANALHLADAGAAILCPQTEFDAASLSRQLGELANDRARLEHMSEAAAGRYQPNAALILADALEEVSR